MSYSRERDEFLSIMGAEGISITVARALLRESTTLQRLAELECSSERADRDQVKCPGRPTAGDGTCLCRGYGSWDVHAGEHGTVPRHMVKSAAATARISATCATYNLTPHFGGDPRGCMLVVSVPSGRTNDWERRGIAIPAQGYTAAQIDRISR